jgi:dipeptidase D
LNPLLQLDPPEVWKHFLSLTRIPRPSGREERVREFVAGFGRELGLESLVDGAGNVIIRKAATPGMEGRQGVILQAHLDMVPQKNSGSSHDFGRDPVEAVVDGGWVRAEGTTLGADNGLGAAAIMAVLESTTLRHGPLEALFTAEEEAGMTGARGLQPGVLKGSILMNLDSEDEGELFIGCAGGLDGIMTFHCSRVATPPGHQCLELRVTGLKGGHSGMDIHLGRGNANKVMNRLLHEGFRHGMSLASIEGGNLRNAIPREAFARVVLPAGRVTEFLEAIHSLAAAIFDEMKAADPGLAIETVAADLPETVIEREAALRVTRAVHGCPNGVLRMSVEMPGLVETSNNLAVVKSDGERVTVECLLRSSLDSARDDLAAMIGSVFELAGAGTRFEGGYPGWKPDPASPVLKMMRELYASKFGSRPEVRAVHAGLECGIIGGTYPGLDMISFGPTIRHPHSPHEKVEIASVRRFYDLLVEVLERVPSR